LSCIFIRPALPDGKLPSTNDSYPDPGDYADWDDWDTSDIVDAQDLSKNWAIIYSHANGRINGTDFNTGEGAALSEATYVADWEGTNEWPTVGHRHSHDGVDSSFLADSVLTYDILGAGAHGIFRCPTKDYRGLLMSSEAVPEITDSTTPFAFWDYFSIPFDSYRWLGASGKLYRDTSGAARFLIQGYWYNFENWTDHEQSSYCMPFVDVEQTGDYLDPSQVKMRRHTLWDGTFADRQDDFKYQILTLGLT